MRMQTRVQFQTNWDDGGVKMDVLPFSCHQVLEEKEWTIFASAASNVDK